MGERLDLQALLAGFQHGLNVYFQPPPSFAMVYPAIVYNRDNQDIKHADNSPYARKTRYQITVIDPDPDSLIPDMVANLPSARMVRHFTTEGLNHDIYQLYF